jgi:hypothetical protein
MYRPVDPWRNGLRGAAPIPNFAQSFCARVLEQANFVTRVFELVNVGPDFGLPRDIVRGGFAAGGATRMKRYSGARAQWQIRQLDKNAADFLYLVIGAHKVLVTQQVAKSQLTGLVFGFLASVKWAELGSQLLG